MHRNAELEAAIAADPDSVDSYLVYADWLLERGDSRGELITVQLKREQAPDDAALAERERELVHEHAYEQLAGLALLCRPVKYTWRRGFIDTASIRGSYESEDGASGYLALASLPVTLLRELEISAGCSYNGRPPDDDSVVKALRDCPSPALRSLVITNEDQDISWTHVGELAIAGDALRGLESLTISAGRMTLGRLDLPKLRSLALVTGGLRSHVLADLAAAAWPSLTSLVIYFGTSDYGGNCAVADTQPILDGAQFPSVTDLALCNGTFADELVAAVARSQLLPRLARLDLSKGTLGIEGARVILEHAGAFAHLESLDLSGSYLPASVCEQLKYVCAGVDVSHQKVEDEWGRYVTVSE